MFHVYLYATRLSIEGRANSLPGEEEKEVAVCIGKQRARVRAFARCCRQSNSYIDLRVITVAPGPCKELGIKSDGGVEERQEKARTYREEARGDG